MARSPPPPPPSPAQGNGNGSGSGSLTARDALAYIKAVKDNFQEKRHTYEQFLQVMRDFKSNRLDSAGLIARVKTLFHGYPDLVLGINAFLPKGHAIRPQDLSEDKEPVDYPRAINLVNRIKIRFQQEEHVYKSFLGILSMYRMDNKPIQDVYDEVTLLFHGHPDLLEEFTHFLPDTPIPPPEAGTTSKVRNDDKNAITHSAMRAQTVQRERALPSAADSDSSVDRLDLEHDIQKGCIGKDKVRNACHGQHRRYYKRNRKNDKYENEDLDAEQSGPKSQRKVEGTGDDTPGVATMSSFNCNEGDSDPEKESKVRNDDKNAIMHSAMRAQTVQSERALPSAADSDSSVDRLDLEHDIQKECIEKDKVRNACHDQHRGDYKRNMMNDEYENEDLDAEQSGPKSQRKVEGTGDDTPGVATMSSFNCNEGDNDPEKESKVRNDDKNAIMHSAMRAQTVQRERALPSAADSDSSVDRLDLEHDIRKGCIEKDKVRNACHGQHRRYYNRNRKNDKYENEDLDAEQSGPKSQRKVEGTSDDTPGVATMSSFNCNEGDNDPEKESKVRNDDKNAIMHSAMRAQTVQSERALPSAADSDSSVDRLDLEHDIQKECIEKDKVRNACHDQHRGDYKRNRMNDEYENEDLDAEQSGPKSQRKVEGTGDDTPGVVTMSSFNCNEGDNDPEEESKVRNDNKNAIMHSAMRAQTVQRERALLSAADSDSSVDRLDLEHDIRKGCIEKDKVRNACHGQHRRDYKRNRKNDEYENEDLDAERSGPKSQRKVEGTGDDSPGIAAMSSFNCNEGDSDPEKERYNERGKSERVLTFNSKEGAAHEASTFPSKEKYNLCKPISELDLSNCQWCTPSYRLLPKNV
ncbi:uncharacterized protein [Zea mays]|uniref:uncharacterized protein isoform X4 n=1 Tax=Zea mays TaxID=4577 RepID=UPI0009AA164A|nr:uncharacterized protein LOC103650483 isoform X4 [Zea mays]|eukprot:XP_020405878.1 uncharacterized protein LOC103650483 isoform X4 [Zea mays]